MEQNVLNTSPTVHTKEPIVEGMASRGQDFRMAVGMDHMTPVSIRTHNDLSVPFLVYDSRQTGTKSGLDFSEENGEKSGCLLNDGKEFFAWLLGR